MRIVLVSPLPPARDGIADYSARLAVSYREAGHTVATVDARGAVTPEGALGVLSWSPTRMLALVRRLRAWRPDVVHVQHGIATYGTQLAPLWLLALACRVLGVPVVVTHHEVTRDISRLGLPARAYYAVVSRIARLVHVHTEAARRSVRDDLRIAERRVLQLPHPVYP